MARKNVWRVCQLFCLGPERNSDHFESSLTPMSFDTAGVLPEILLGAQCFVSGQVTFLPRGHFGGCSRVCHNPIGIISIAACSMLQRRSVAPFLDFLEQARRQMAQK